MPFSLRFHEISGVRDENYISSLPVIDVYGRSSITVRIGCCLGFPHYCLHGSSSCLGCDNRPKLISSLNEPLKGQNNPKATMSDGFWTTSTCDLENNAVQSRGSISSTSTLTQMHDVHDASSSTKPTEFVNHGLLLWNQTRQKWVGNKKPETNTDQLREPKLRALCQRVAKKFWPCSWNATYDNLLSSNKPFRQPVPLGEMIDFLVDIWEQEGLYD